MHSLDSYGQGNVGIAFAAPRLFDPRGFRLAIVLA